MESIATQIANILASENLSAPEMTHALKVLGDGDMLRGLKDIVIYFRKENAIAESLGLKKGRFQGVIIGLATAVACYGLYRIFKPSKNSKADLETIESHELEGERILSVLKSSIPSSSVAIEGNTCSSRSDESHNSSNEEKESGIKPDVDNS